MTKFVLAFMLLHGASVFAHDLKQCHKSYQISAAKTFYGCETCMEVDSGACVYTEATCYQVTTTEHGELREIIDCAPHTCGDVPNHCSIIYIGIEELQSLEGQIVSCSDGSRKICSKQTWIPYKN